MTEQGSIYSELWQNDCSARGNVEHYGTDYAIDILHVLVISEDMNE